MSRVLLLFAPAVLWEVRADVNPNRPVGLSQPPRFREGLSPSYRFLTLLFREQIERDLGLKVLVAERRFHVIGSSVGQAPGASSWWTLRAAFWARFPGCNAGPHATTPTVSLVTSPLIFRSRFWAWISAHQSEPRIWPSNRARLWAPCKQANN